MCNADEVRGLRASLVTTSMGVQSCQLREGVSGGRMHWLSATSVVLEGRAESDVR